MSTFSVSTPVSTSISSCISHKPWDWPTPPLTAVSRASWVVAQCVVPAGGLPWLPELTLSQLVMMYGTCMSLWVGWNCELLNSSSDCCDWQWKNPPGHRCELWWGIECEAGRIVWRHNVNVFRGEIKKGPDLIRWWLHMGVTHEHWQMLLALSLPHLVRTDPGTPFSLIPAAFCSFV